ncbi:conserved Plasmodium protein, unknown function [Plasmodium berghei]|uniref:Uncharacterized protein n=2 Tax=Plasmodium berghei TaxID=5821 RepID=A0A509AIC5_PLABA|nr:conserved Plasmodium protein, unknown function [Plasmodium berghei ANKA]CXI30045.1 conserved Plasmodium protein, unknown function [Plasmodium berghei]SCM20815.1 conserved Plasmodium protein, unknown function [Plasmodium berghei]SCN24335.1 conserved Plasmodium protein, unknown function [Plasmodium berghei]SCO59508.1 conserved Plasmodium protein, unknown function [Plasmodium berghei]SCO60737.1 conserved Plasmodium protein, unknown function [Plasmodium berghei]|eukprot:XP_034421039.1 conserved Plasmodium protein, unknown function [Plasmodium berghei ANKA]
MNITWLSIYVIFSFAIQTPLKSFLFSYISIPMIICTDSNDTSKKRNSQIIKSADALIENITEIIYYLENVNNYVIDYNKELFLKLEYLIQHDNALYDSFEHNEKVLNQIYKYYDNILNKYSTNLKTLKDDKINIFNEIVTNIQSENKYYTYFIYKNILSKIDLISDMNKKKIDKDKEKNIKNITQNLEVFKNKLMDIKKNIRDVIIEKFENIKKTNEENIQQIENQAHQYLHGNSKYDTFSRYIINDFLLNDKKINIINYENNYFFKTNFMYFNFLLNYIKEKKSSYINNKKLNFNIYIYLKETLIKEIESAYHNYYVIPDLHIIDVIIKNANKIMEKEGKKNNHYTYILVCIDNYIVKYNILSSNIYLDMVPSIKSLFTSKSASDINSNKMENILFNIKKQNQENYTTTIFENKFYQSLIPKENDNIQNNNSELEKDTDSNQQNNSKTYYFMKKNIFFDSKKQYYKKFLSYYAYEEIFNILCNNNAACSSDIIDSINRVNKSTFVIKMHLKLKNELKKFLQIHQTELKDVKKCQSESTSTSEDLDNENNQNSSSRNDSKGKSNASCFKKQSEKMPNENDNFINMGNISDFLNTYYISYHKSFKVANRKHIYSLLSHIFESYLNNKHLNYIQEKYKHIENANSITLHYLGVLPEIIKVYKTFNYCEALYQLGITYLMNNFKNTEDDENNKTDENNKANEEISKEIDFLKNNNEKYMEMFQSHLNSEIKFINFFEFLIQQKIAFIYEENEFLKLYIYYGKKELPQLPYTPLFSNCRTIIKIEVLRDTNTKQIIYSGRSFFLETLITLKEYKIKNKSAYIVIETSDENSTIKKRLKLEMLYKISPFSHINAYIISNDGIETVYHKGNIYQRSASDIKDVISDIRNDFLNVILPQHNMFDLIDNYIYIIICLKNENC